MYKIAESKRLSENVKLVRVFAPHVAKKAKPGQFVMLRVNEGGERIPLTIADYDRENGIITVIFQEVGKTTKLLGALSAGDSILDFAGPLGKATEFCGEKSVCVIGGGLGSAIAYPQAKAFAAAGAEVDVIAGFRTKDLVILEEEFRSVANLFIATDDGSYMEKGFVTDVLKKRLEEKKYDLIVVIGPIMMMKAVAQITKGIKTICSMNSIMIDGTGMCGCCRLTVGGRVKFACVDGPDFDAHLVDFDEAAARGRHYAEEERESLHLCNLTGEARNG